MPQYVSLKADGFLPTKSSQVLALEAQPLVDQAAPAQSPQKVISKT